MKTTVFILASLFVIASSLTAPAAESKETGKSLYHIVSIKFKEGTMPEQIKAVEEAFGALKSKIPAITSLHWGTNISPENKNKGFTHCFVLTFATEADRDVYLKHDDHKAFGKVLGPGECYCYLRLPMLGGGFEPDNFVIRDVVTHFQIWGPIHEQLRDLPDGATVRFEVVE